MNQEINHSNFLDKKHYKYAFVCIIFLAIALRLLGINKGIGLDDYASIHMFSQPTLAKTLQELRADTHPPLYFVLLHFWTQINHSDAWMRLPSIFFSVATIFVVTKWLKSSSLAALLGALFFATSPILLRYSHEIRGYSLLVFATTLTFFFASRLLERPEQKFGYFGLAFSLIVAVSTHIIGVMLVLPICVFIAFTSILKNQKIYWTKLLASLFIPCLVFILFYSFFLNNKNAASRISWLPSLSFDLISFVTNFLVGGSTTSYYPNNLESLITFIIFGMIGYLTIVVKSKNGLPLLITAIIYWLELVIYSSLKTEIYWFTTALPILVPLVAFTAIQISSIQKKNLKKIAIAVFLIISLFFAVTWGISEAWKPLEEYEKVARLLEKEWQPNNLGIIYPSYIHNPIKYYWHKLPLKSVIPLAINSDLKQFNEKLNKIENPDTIFLVFRVESGLKKNLENLQAKLLSLASKFKNSSQIEEFLIISNSFKKVDKDEESLKKLLAVQESIFGKIVSYDDFNSYIIIKFRST